MPDYRRAIVPGGTFFFTLVTAERRRILCERVASIALQEAFEEVRSDRPFEEIASVVLPDHLHCIWELPEDDHDFSVRWKRIKAGFTRRYLRRGGSEASASTSRKQHGDRGVWQRRFWEHTIRDEADLNRHLDYIHYNPVKHGLVSRPVDWTWSSFHRFAREAHYPKDWGAQEPESVRHMHCE